MITVMKEVNLCTYFLLPLLGLSERSFGEGNFTNSFLDRAEPFIYVGVSNLDRIPLDVRQGSSKIVAIDGTTYLRFRFPDLWALDIKKFAEGKYSTMSSTAKQAIRTYSGLMYKEEREGMMYSDFRLTALERSPALVEELKNHLYSDKDSSYGVTILDTDPTTELLEAPGYYMFFNKEIESIS